MLNWLKRYCIKRYISDNKPVRYKELISLDKAKSIGVVAVITDEHSYRDVFSIFTRLQHANKMVRMVAYIDEKSVPYYCLEQLTADYFCQKDLNWYQKPMMVQVHDFMRIEFDMLIDFSNTPLPPVHTVLQLSHAKMIVGANTNYRHEYDLFMDDPELGHLELIKCIELYSRKLMGEK